MEAAVPDLPGRYQRVCGRRPGDDVPVRLREARKSGEFKEKQY